MKALVVDDVAYSRLITQKALNDLGFTVLQAASGAEALSVLKNNADIDLVITDLMMADMDGVELFESARGVKDEGEQGAHMPPPFILLTASHLPELLRKAKQEGFVDVLLKPLDAKRLSKTIEQCLFGRVDLDSELDGALSQLASVIQGCIHRGDAERLLHIRAALGERLKWVEAHLKTPATGAGERED